MAVHPGREVVYHTLRRGDIAADKRAIRKAMGSLRHPLQGLLDNSRTAEGRLWPPQNTSKRKNAPVGALRRR
jgi:hypothetical protein